MALIYNNWIFYLPTSAELEAEFELEPVMCSTTRNVGERNRQHSSPGLQSVPLSLVLSFEILSSDWLKNAPIMAFHSVLMHK